MPSAARQRLPVDLWRQQGHRKHLNGSPGLFHNTQEIQVVQASPGHCDVFQEDKQQNWQGSKSHLNKSPRKQADATGRGSPKFVMRRGSVNTPCIGLSDSENSAVIGRTEMVELSSSAKSDSYLSYNPSRVSGAYAVESSDAYAMESSVAPHPNEVPFPPLEWLQSSSRHSISPVISDKSLGAILSCHIAA